jgi:hypothetical protein
VIIRIFSDGQYRLPDAAMARINELDADAQQAVDADDEDAFTRCYAALITQIHESGERLDDADLSPSDLMLPPADTTLAEARSNFTGEGLIPD